MPPLLIGATTEEEEEAKGHRIRKVALLPRDACVPGGSVKPREGRLKRRRNYPSCPSVLNLQRSMLFAPLAGSHRVLLVSFQHMDRFPAERKLRGASRYESLFRKTLLSSVDLSLSP